MDSVLGTPLPLSCWLPYRPHVFSTTWQEGALWWHLWLPALAGHIASSLHLQGPGPPHLQLRQAPGYLAQLLLLLHPQIRPGIQDHSGALPALYPSALGPPTPAPSQPHPHHCCPDPGIMTKGFSLVTCPSLSSRTRSFQNPHQTRIFSSSTSPV